MPLADQIRLASRRRRGVTLTELLVAVTIITIIASFGFYMCSTALRFGANLEKEVNVVAAKAKPKIEKKFPAPPPQVNPNPDSGPGPDTPQPKGPEEPKRPLFARVGRIPQAPGFGRRGKGRADNRIPRSPSRPTMDRGPWALAPAGMDRFALAHLGLNAFRPHGVTSDFPDNELATAGYLCAAPILRDSPGPEQLCAAPVGNDLVWKTYPGASAFLLHSNPGANCVIYMDFKGYTTAAGNPWNALVNGGNTITQQPWSIDGDRSTFSAAELDKIIVLWRMVAEDFMPFDVDVTTEDPGVADLVDSGAGDTKWGMRAVIGPQPKVSNGSSTGWDTAGGIAFLNSFRSKIDTVCWVWNGDSDPNCEDSLPLTVSHEVGHTLGLDHDGDKSSGSGYYGGHGSGATGWGPIMGAPFGLNLTQWSRDTYPNADNSEDDLTIIVSGNGFGYRPDDYGDTMSTASPLNGAGQAKLTTTHGIIEHWTDVDFFKFYADPGPLKIQIDPLFIGPNVDVQADLYNASGKLLMTSNPTASLDATLNMTVVDKGVFYVKITGAALLPVKPKGYPNYGCLGSFRITGDVTPYTPPFASFRALNPIRWKYDPFTRLYDGNITITNVTSTAFTGSFTFVLTLPDPSVTVASPGGTASGQTFAITYDGTIAPNAPIRLHVFLRNPLGIPLATGSNTFVTDIKSQ